MRAFPFLFGTVRHMRLIGEDYRHKALRARNEARLVALKAANRLYEDKREPTPTERARLASARNATSAERATASWNELQCTDFNAGNGHEVGSALASIIGITNDSWLQR